MRRIKRTKDFDVSLEIKNPDFIAPPRESQRRWLVNRALADLACDLEALDVVSRGFVRGDEIASFEGRAERPMGHDEIMEDWQRPLMKAMSQIAGESGGDVLEVGFGLGVSATFIQRLGVRSHTIIECNDSVVEWLREWQRDYPDRDIRLVHGLWQDTIGALGTFDSIFFHTYPVSEEEAVEHVSSNVTYAEHFFASAAAHLDDGGVFTYMTNEIDSLSRAHQRALFKQFSSVSLQVLESLEVPPNTRDAWWADRMVLVKAVK